MLSATMNIIGHTSLLNMKVGGSQTQGSGSNLRDQQPQKNSSSSQNKNNASTEINFNVFHLSQTLYLILRYILQLYQIRKHFC